MPEPKIRATIPVPDHSDLRGFSYRAPTNTQGYNDSPKKTRSAGAWRGQLPRKRGFWSRVWNFLNGRGEAAAHPLNPEQITKLMPPETTEPSPGRGEISEEFRPRPARVLPRDRDASPIWPG